ncbi:MAG: tetratricopeptide repeat protein [Phycisphaerales bacterium]|nr:tetratricopeptide repeat protein [Phycisphaerales bacterium]
MMKRWIVFVLVTLVLSPSACNQPQSSAGRLSQASAARSDAASAANARETPPPKILPQTHFAAGQLLEAQGQFDQALVQYQRAVLLNHRHVAAYHRMGTLLARMGRHREAIEALTKAADLRPDAYVLYNNLGFEYAILNEWDAAEAHLRRAIDLNPTFERARVNLGMVLCRQGQFDSALEQFRTVLPESEAQYNLGLMYAGAKRYRDAGLAYHRALQLDPNLIAAQTQLAYLSKYVDRTDTSQESAPAPEAEQVGYDEPMQAQALTGDSFDHTSGESFSDATEDSSSLATGESSGDTTGDMSEGVSAEAPLMDDCDEQEIDADSILTDLATPADAEPAEWVDNSPSGDGDAPCDEITGVDESDLSNPFVIPQDWTVESSGATTVPSIQDEWVMEFIRSAVLSEAPMDSDSTSVIHAVPVVEPAAPLENAIGELSGDASFEPTTDDPCNEAIEAWTGAEAETETPAPAQAESGLASDEAIEEIAAVVAEPLTLPQVAIAPLLIDPWADLYVDDCEAFENELDEGLELTGGWNSSAIEPTPRLDSEAVVEAAVEVETSALTGQVASPVEPEARIAPDLLPLDPTWLETMHGFRTTGAVHRANQHWVTHGEPVGFADVEVGADQAKEVDAAVIVLPGPISAALPFRLERLARIENPSPLP